jgi:anti-sigma factor RsiW
MSDQEDCPRIESLSALIDDELETRQSAALQAHVAGCAICAPMLAGMRRLHADLVALPTPRGDFDLAVEVDRRIGALQPPHPSRPLRPSGPRWWQVAVLAPGGAMAVAAGLWLGASMMPAAGSATAAQMAAQMAAFSPLPPGALCPVSKTCGRTLP